MEEINIADKDLTKLTFKKNADDKLEIEEPITELRKTQYSKEELDNIISMMEHDLNFFKALRLKCDELGSK